MGKSKRLLLEEKIDDFLALCLGVIDEETYRKKWSRKSNEQDSFMDAEEFIFMVNSGIDMDTIMKYELLYKKLMKDMNLDIPPIDNPATRYSTDSALDQLNRTYPFIKFKKRGSE